jgi:hypothetical protein
MKISKSDLRKLTLAMENKNLSIAQVIELVENSKNVAELAVISDPDGEIKLTIDYTKTIKQAIGDGNYDCKNSDITIKHFPVSPEMIGKKVEVSAKQFHFKRDISSDDAISEMDKAGYRPATLIMIGKKVEVSAKLFHFSRDISSDDAISEMDKAGYRPATLMELLVLGILFPELQRQFPIVALGSVWRPTSDGRCVPYLDGSGSGRGLGLGWFDDGWYADYRFLGVRK